MRTNHPFTTAKTPAKGFQQPAFWLRVMVVLAILVATASFFSARSADTPYEEQLVDLALRQTYGDDWGARIINSSVAVKALLLDYDHELAFKTQLALEKYGDDAQDVLERFGDDPTFHEIIRLYGENIIPVVSYFVHNDIASIRLIYLAQQKSDATLAAAKQAWARFWQKEKAPDRAENPISETYGPALRGQRAIVTILDDGHQFLGQFVLDPDGKAVWIQTERSAQAVKSLFLSGAINLEQKYKTGKPLEPADVLSAGMDGFIFLGAFKALKVLRTTQEVRTVGLMKRTQLLGAPLLGKSALGRYAMKYGVTAGTLYLVARHPTLFSGVFMTIGQWLGLPPFLSKTIGWTVLLALLLVPVLALLALALRLLAFAFGAANKGVAWAIKTLGWRVSPAA